MLATTALTLASSGLYLGHVDGGAPVRRPMIAGSKRGNPRESGWGLSLCI